MQRARKQQTCKQHRPSGPNPERGVTSSPCGQPTWGLAKYHGSRWGPRGPEWSDTWTCPCAPQGLAKAHVPHPSGCPHGKIQTLHLGGGIPRDVLRRPLPVFGQNPKTAQKKIGRNFPLTEGELFGCQPSVCAPATDGVQVRFVCWPARPANSQRKIYH